MLCALLGGIVALNVLSLSINTTSGRVSEAVDHYERSNSALRAEIAEQLSASRVEAAAASLGLAVPAPENVTYLDARDGDLERLARVWSGDDFLAYDGGYESASPATYAAEYGDAGTATTVPSATAPAASAPVAPVSSPPAPSAGTPAPAASAPTGGASTGGVGL